MEKKEVLVLGEDERQFYLARELESEGFTVVYRREIQFAETGTSDETQFEKSHLILLPIAAKVEMLNFVGEQVRKGQRIYGGVLPKAFCQTCEEKEVFYYDYMKDDAVSIRNAVATAEGAIAEAILSSEINLHKSKCLVIGFGRCGEILADKLQGLKCNVSIMARKEEAKAKAEAYGYDALSFSVLQEHTDRSDNRGWQFIFNTVPALIIGRKFLEQLNKEVTIIDIASNPGGVDYEACRELGINAKLCPGLPGRYAPETSAHILAEVIFKNEKQLINE